MDKMRPTVISDKDKKPVMKRTFQLTPRRPRDKCKNRHFSFIDSPSPGQSGHVEPNSLHVVLGYCSILSKTRTTST